MRLELSLAVFTLLIATVRGAAPALQQTENHRRVASEPGARRHPDALDCADFRPYAADPNHLWNRVHRRLLERRDAKGNAWGCDEVDPLLWQQSKHVLASPAYAETVRLLDEFINAHAEQLIHDPLQRAIFQRNMWAVFDWLARPTDDHPRERAELER